MTSAIDNLLLDTLNQCRGSTLLVADENCLEFPFAGLDPAIAVTSNRFDVASRARAAGLATDFSDFHIAADGLDNLVYRLSKEKPVVHHIANRAAAALKPGGQLWLAGAKQEGIKTFARTIGQRFGDNGQLTKHGPWYLARICRSSTATQPLDDSDYPTLREIFAIAGIPVYSKPGLFGWDRVDAGSELLAGYLREFFDDLDGTWPRALLDLGCGYGYLGLMAHHQASVHITATDNCAAALVACERNFSLHGVTGTVVADDCAAAITGPFDIVLCNPPFHQGFQQERRLTEKFLAATRRLLAPGGRALFVVNQFVPLESLARPLFRTLSTPQVKGGFKLVVLARPGR